MKELLNSASQPASAFKSIPFPSFCSNGCYVPPLCLCVCVCVSMCTTMSFCYFGRGKMGLCRIQKPLVKYLFFLNARSEFLLLQPLQKLAAC